MATERIDRLPKWAQERIALLERRLREERERREELVPAVSEASRVVVDDYPHAPGYGFASDVTAQFFVGTEAGFEGGEETWSRSTGSWISVRALRERDPGLRGCLSVNTPGTHLIVVPRASNVIHLYARSQEDV